MADTNLGSTSIRTVWDRVRTKGLIPKKDTLNVTQSIKAYAILKAGKTLERLSAQAYIMPTPE